MVDEEVQALVQSLDTAGTQTIGYNDFISALISRKMCHPGERCVPRPSTHHIEYYKFGK